MREDGLQTQIELAESTQVTHKLHTSYTNYDMHPLGEVG